MVKEKQFLSDFEIRIIIERLCQELIENHNDFKDTVIIGIQPRGVLLKTRIINNISLSFPKTEIQSGSIDISFYRDDFRRRSEPIIPSNMDIDFSVEDKKVVLVDDVLYTGRSVRSAIDALMSFGRPKSVQLLVLVDRKFSRDLPIQANYIGKKVDALCNQRVKVEWKEISGIDQVNILNLE